MKTALWLMAAALPLAAQPKLLVNAQADTRSAAAGLEQTLRPLITAQPQPAWIGYSVPGVRAFMGCDYVRDGFNQPGVVHLEPPDHVIVLFRVDGGEIQRIRTLSPDCQIDAGGLPMHWLNDVKAPESIALLQDLAAKRDRYSDSAMNAIAMHSDPAAEAVLKRYLDPSQPSAVRARAVGWFGNYRGRSGFEVLKNLAANDIDQRVRERAVSTLGGSREPESIDVLINIARKDPDPRLRQSAISALNRRSGKKVLDTFQFAIENDPDVSVKRRAVSALQSMPDGEGIPLLIQVARTTKDNEVRKQAMNSLSNSHDMRAVTFFEDVLKK
jgi:HEAT repeats